ncbi:MAG: aromatic-ring-hydroxylating dioxygenase subunit beta [Actinomycetota bacterium]|nr:aromatic-ring-hydroxylating dioxygenase subunit beta [Actinomycetota bacterium]
MTTVESPATQVRPTRQDVEDFLYAEAALLDAAEYKDWLDLFTDDCIYWIPSQVDEVDPTRQVSLVYDEHKHLSERVRRFASGIAYAQEPRSRTARVVNNVRITGVEAGDVPGQEILQVEVKFFVAEFRRGHEQLHAGTARYRLLVQDGGFRIKSKKVELINNAGYLGNLSVLL